MGFISEIVTPPVYVGRFGGIGENVALTVKKINGRVSVDVILDGRRMHWRCRTRFSTPQRLMGRETSFCASTRHSFGNQEGEPKGQSREVSIGADACLPPRLRLPSLDLGDICLEMYFVADHSPSESRILTNRPTISST